MLTLALDTSTGQGGVAVVDGETVLSEERWTRVKSHSEIITSVIRDRLAAAGVGLGELKRIAVGRGPGSFTGIRIAVNAARTLAYSLGIPVHAYDTNTILAAAVPATEGIPLVTLVNAHKNLLYVRRFEARGPAWSRDGRPEALDFDAISRLLVAPHLCVGDGYLESEAVFPPELKSKLLRRPGLADHPDPGVLGRLPVLLQDPPLDWKRVQALYVRASEAEEKLQDRLGTEPRG